MLLKFRSDLEEKVEREFESKTFDLLLQVPGVTNVCVGRTFTTDRSRGYTHAIRVRLKSREDLKVYAKHELHLKLKKENIAPLLDKTQKDPVCAVDIVSRDAKHSDQSRGSFMELHASTSK